MLKTTENENEEEEEDADRDAKGATCEKRLG